MSEDGEYGQILSEIEDHTRVQRELAELRRLEEASAANREMYPGARSVIEEAAEIINGQRQVDYGGPRESFGRIAELWTAYLRGVDLRQEDFLSAHDVAMMMILLKVSRAANGIRHVGQPQRDSLVDICGYAGCSELVAEAE